VLILVRHGRTAANAAGLLQGRGDLSLDEVGREQVRQVVAAIGPIDHVITSPLARARETGLAFGAPTTTIDDRWIELDYGLYEGLRTGDVPAEVWAQWRRDELFAPPQGESMQQLDDRVRAACVDALEMARDQIVVVVSHVSPIKAAMAWALGGDISLSWRCHLAQAAVCRIANRGGSAVLVSFNEVLHTLKT
jgi:probable phosphoglycerate mutase